jgi:hypothetical protein
LVLTTNNASGNFLSTPTNKKAPGPEKVRHNKAAMNRPQRFRGLATDPGVQRKAPKAVFWRTGSRLEEPIEIQAGDCRQ